jgi:hypothetical protein
VGIVYILDCDLFLGLSAGMVIMYKCKKISNDKKTVSSIQWSKMTAYEQTIFEFLNKIYLIPILIYSDTNPNIV